MIKIEKVSVMGFEPTIRGMRNPLESWEKTDSIFEHDGMKLVSIGPNDLGLMKRLSKAGPDHGKFLRMITVYVDITAPLYWWKEFDTYKIGTVANSCSTMHCIHKHEFTLEDFSHDHLCATAIKHLEETIALLNFYRQKYLETKEKLYWWQMIQLLPSSYNQKRTVLLNYEVLSNMVHSRYAHKLDEWRQLCKWTWMLPYPELIWKKTKEELEEI